MNRLILWDRSTDSFTDGQWLKHKVYPERCDLSPDGRHFLYFALNGKWNSVTKGSYTALSQPPYFTALSLFPVGDTWSGGGAFVNNHYYIADGDKDVVNHPSETRRIIQGPQTKNCRTGFYDQQSGQPAKIGKDRIEAARTKRETGPNAPSDYIAKGAKLFRLIEGQATLIRDFTDMAFSPIKAPYDRRSDDSLPTNGHPLDEAFQ